MPDPRHRWMYDPADLTPEPPPEHALDDRRSASGEVDDQWEAEWGDNPFGEYHR